ncbi:hypothetical protein COU54_04110 [Candidatus Pacearchaeota archaeon CG10_big_fil_rev_8_21_14_0_10_31_24]|nr:MAG: hypothetical protein COU54_04110 [Candidatus Pacearchaeota archaeon CG10_big_fil_rev_8_21_14_0_10_31_24]
MKDIFDATIFCKECKVEMEPILVKREGFDLRAVQCSNCKDKIVHPSDLNALEQFDSLRGKIFSVKLRMVGNSHAISIPKEIFDFMKEQQRNTRKEVDDMVRLCCEDFRRLSVIFGQ